MIIHSINFQYKPVIILLIIQVLFCCCSSNKEAVFRNGVYKWNHHSGVWYEELKIKGDKIRIFGGGCVTDFYGKGKLVIISDSCSVINYVKYMNQKGVHVGYIDSIKYHKNSDGETVLDNYDFDSLSAFKQFEISYIMSIIDTKSRYWNYKKRMKKSKREKKKNEA